MTGKPKCISYYLTCGPCPQLISRPHNLDGLRAGAAEGGGLLVLLVEGLLAQLCVGVVRTRRMGVVFFVRVGYSISTR